MYENYNYNSNNPYTSVSFYIRSNNRFFNKIYRNFMTIILAKDFNTRGDLENNIRNTLGLTPDHKPNYIIQGTKQELNKLFLSDKSIFWGIRTELIDDKGKKVIIKKEKSNINRGKIIKSGINIKN